MESGKIAPPLDQARTSLTRLRVIEKIDWLNGRSPLGPVSRESGVAIALVAL